MHTPTKTEPASLPSPAVPIALAARPARRRRRRAGQRRPWGTLFTRPDRVGVYVRFTWAKHRYSRLGGMTSEDARAKLARTHAALVADRPIGAVLADLFGDTNGESMTFGEAWNGYLPVATQQKRNSTLVADERRILPILKAPWASKQLRAITSQEIQAWADERRKPRTVEIRRLVGKTWRMVPKTVTTSGATVNRDLALISAVFKWAWKRGHVEANPVRRVEKESERGREREVYLSAQESRALVDAASPILRPLLVTALSTGMRRGELLSLPWRCLDLARREITIEAQAAKGKVRRVVPMTIDLHALLSDLARSAPALDGEDRVFLDAQQQPMGEGTLRLTFESALARAAIPETKRQALRFHDLRHTAASLMVAAGVSIFDVSKILGHATLRMTLRYVHFAPEAGRAAVERLGSALGIGQGVSRTS